MALCVRVSVAGANKVLLEVLLVDAYAPIKVTPAGGEAGHRVGI